MRRLDHGVDFTVPAPPERVFPLLCPTLDYKWIPTWQCDLLHSESGVAEEDCVFRTNLPEVGPMTWTMLKWYSRRRREH